MAWEDDFDTLDESTWRRVHSTQPTNNSLQAYLPEQVGVRDGALVITATDQPYQGLAYRSGQVISRGEQLHGRWEVRADLPTSAGQWPAIWLLPDTSRHAWPSGGEIDIMENRGAAPTITSSAFHYGTNPPYSHQYVYQEQRTNGPAGIADYHSGYHTYAVDWTEHYLRFYVDGVNYYTVHDEDVGGFLSQRVQPMQLVINNAIGGTFLPDPDGTSEWPQEMLVDWVRVYEQDGSPAPRSLANRGFEADGGSLRGWSVFGADLLQNPNVAASATSAHEGDAALKVFGTFSASEESYSGVSQGVAVEAGQTVRAELSSLVRSDDPLLDGNRALLKLEFYDRYGAKYGSDNLLGEHEVLIADPATPTDAWAGHQIEAVAPAGAAEARLSVVFHQPLRGRGAVYVDSVDLYAVTPLSLGDFNGDGVVNSADYVVWRNESGSDSPTGAADANGDGLTDEDDLRRWSDNYGESVPAPASPETVPEPSTGALLLFGGAAAQARASITKR